MQLFRSEQLHFYEWALRFLAVLYMPFTIAEMHFFSVAPVSFWVIVN